MFDPFVFKPSSGQAGGVVTSKHEAPSGGTLDSLNAIAAVGPGRAFAVGVSQSNVNMIILDCSVTCVDSPHPFIMFSDLRAVWGYSASDVWAVGATPSASLILHYDGTSWTSVASPNVGVLNGVWGVASDDVWAVGDNGILRWNGSVWSQVVGLPIGLAKAVSGTNSNDVWVAAGGNGIWHWNGSNWLQSYNNTVDVDGIDVVDAGDVWAVTNAGGTLNYTAAQHFTDVAPNNVFYPYVQTLACRGIISGYPCGAVGEPCDTQQRPYFRTNNNVTRGQLAKIVAGAAGFNEQVGVQSFQDLLVGDTFYPYVERLDERGLVNGYPCGSPGEECVPPE